MVALEDLAGVIVTQSRGGGTGGIVEKMYADGKIRGVDESGAVLLHHGADVIHIFVPAGGADDHVLTRLYARGDVIHHAVRGGEVQHYIEGLKDVGGEYGGICIFLRADN